MLQRSLFGNVSLSILWCLAISIILHACKISTICIWGDSETGLAIKKKSKRSSKVSCGIQAEHRFFPHVPLSVKSRGFNNVFRQYSRTVHNLFGLQWNQGCYTVLLASSNTLVLPIFFLESRELFMAMTLRAGLFSPNRKAFV